jgi:chromosomal replication initiator protein
LQLDYHDFWEKVKKNLQSKSIDNRPLNLWLVPTELLKINENDGNLEFELGVPTDLHEYWISQNFMSQIRQEIGQFYSNNFDVKIVVDPKVTQKNDESLEISHSLASTLKQHQSKTYNNPSPQPTASYKNYSDNPKHNSSENLDPSYTFSSFVVGRNNEFAHAACYSVAENPASRRYNPLFICGPSGMGKTHLLNAVGTHILTKSPGIKICYVSAERFLNECISSIRRGEMHKFRQKYRDQADMLLIDDIQILGRGEAVQEEFFHTLNEYLESKRQVVVASDKMPKDIKGLEDRIRTRLEWGLVADIQMPDVETRVAILRYKAEEQKIKLSNEVVNYLAKISKRSIRELEGNLNKVRIYSDLNGDAIDLELCKKVLKSHIEQQSLSIEDIQRIVSEHYKIRVQDLKAKSRTKPIVTARQVTMFLIKKHLDKSLVEIGRAFGGKDHTTVINAIKRIESQRIKDSDLSSDIEDLEAAIHNITGL